LAMKITLVEAWPVAKARGTSLKAFALDNEVQPAQIRQWTKNLDTLKEARVKFGISRQTAHGGRVSSLDRHKDALLQWLFELRQDGMTVSIRLLSLQAAKLDAVHRRKLEQTRYGIARRFLLSHGLSSVVVLIKPKPDLKTRSMKPLPSSHGEYAHCGC
jgi:hypothetical protein